MPDFPESPAGTNFFDTDANLRALLARRAPSMLETHSQRLSDFGAWVGGALDEQATYSDRYAPPRLETHGIDGRPLGRVVLNPLYQVCHAEAYERGVIGLAFSGRAPHLLSFTMGYLLSQADIAIHCPITMTGAVAYVLDRLAPPAVRDRYLPELIRMDGKALSGGTWATEHHGGSDVGATTTEARADGDAWRLDGLKWFTSNAGSGIAVATARPSGAPAGSKGLGLYLVPDGLPDGGTNTHWIRRLKDKLGTRGLATGEIELNGAWAQEIAPPPHGLKAMMEALEYSRIHNAVAACGAHRRAFLETACWAAHRQAFGGYLTDFPMVRDVLLDMIADLEAGMALAFEAAATFDRALDDEHARPWLRLTTALAKYLTAEYVNQATTRAVETVGGNGYTEEWPTARLLRDALVLSVWEGPANIQALELLRMVAGKIPGDELFTARIRETIGRLPDNLETCRPALEHAAAECTAVFGHLRKNPADGPKHARRLLDRMARLLSACLLIEEATADLTAGDRRKALVAARYVANRLADRQPIVAEDPLHEHFEAALGFRRIC